MFSMSNASMNGWDTQDFDRKHGSCSVCSLCSVQLQRPRLRRVTDCPICKTNVDRAVRLLCSAQTYSEMIALVTSDIGRSGTFPRFGSTECT